MSGADRRPLSGARWHFQHGPIDLVIGADGDAPTVAAAHSAAWSRFQEVLAELVDELPALRQPVSGRCRLQGRVAQRMWKACAPFAPRFITPMAAVAGAVADEIVAAYHRPGIRRAWVNNGGDIALHLADGESARIGVFTDLSAGHAVAAAALGGRLAVDGQLTIRAGDAVRGIATSGWRGRSHSLGIADSVTVLARCAAMADAAATMIANAVDLDDPRIVRRPACELRDDSDLGQRRVTVEVPALEPERVREALARGAESAREVQRCGLIDAALLVCQRAAVEVGTPRAAALPAWAD